MNVAENILLLCPTCHTLVDKAPREFPVELLLKWKANRQRMLEELIGVARYQSRPEARRGVEPILRANYLVFTQYGPESEAARAPGNEGASHWGRKVLEVILPNNRRLLAALDVNRELLTHDERSTLEAFRQHVDDLEARHIHGLKEKGAMRFPAGMAEVFAS